MGHADRVAGRAGVGGRRWSWVVALVAGGLLACGCTGESHTVRFNERAVGTGIDSEQLSPGLVVDAHVVTYGGYRGDCGPLGEHTSSCEGLDSVEVAVSLLNEAATTGSVPTVEAVCDGKKVATGRPRSWHAGDPIAPASRLTDTVSIQFGTTTCLAPSIRVHHVSAHDGDPALSFFVSPPI